MKKMWGIHDNDSISGEGSSGPWADNSIDDIDEILHGNGALSICDVGCGDFGFGCRIVYNFSDYFAIDISKIVLDINRQKYVDLHHVKFEQLNACTEPLPHADVFLIRQVLQHITNSQIKQIVSNAIQHCRKYVIVFEAQSSRNFVPNKDLPTDGAFTRTNIDSGVDLTVEPFCFPFKRFSVNACQGKKNTQLVCYVYTAPNESIKP